MLEQRERVLAICSFTPFPVHRGDPMRVMGILRALSRRSAVTFWCVESAGSDLAGLQAELPNVKIRQFRRNDVRRLGPISDLTRYIQSTWSGTPPWILKRQSSELVDTLLRDVGHSQILFVLGEASAQYLDGQRGLSWHWDKFNVQTVSRAGEWRERSGIGRALALIDYRATKAYEARLVTAAESFTVTNAEEADRFRATFHANAKVLHGPIELSTAVRRDPVERRLMWLGNMAYSSNRSGLLRFLAGAWELLQAQYTLRVVGSGMTARDRRLLGRYHGVQPVGFVEDLSQEFSRAALGVVPIWSGGGTKIKTLTMMANGLPVVSTPAGLEGIEWATAKAAYVGDSPEALARCILVGSADPLREAVGMAGRISVLTRYSEEAVDRQLQEIMSGIRLGD